MKSSPTAITLMSLCLAACGGGGGSDSPPPPGNGPSDSQRAEAARATAASAANACAAVVPFYWEIGNPSTLLASGAVSTAGGTAYNAASEMQIASATKWLFGAYVAEYRGGTLSAADVKFLNFRSGYSSFLICLPGQTVDECLATASNGDYTAATDGSFLYNGGHMQKLASLVGLGALDNAGLATEMRRLLGTDIGLAFSQPQLAGGAVSTAADYARFLRRLLDGRLRMGAMLGTQAVCTNPTTCASALGTPIPLTESWHYSLGHWVEDDPALGDGAFSSPGAFGFYPWIDATRSWYGILAREGAAGTGVDSVNCGRLIRKAWVSASPQ